METNFKSKAIFKELTISCFNSLKSIIAWLSELPVPVTHKSEKRDKKMWEISF